MAKHNYINSLENQFLLAMPQLDGSYFADTVTYLWKHNNEGALGIVINKPLQVSLADIFDELEITYDSKENRTNQHPVLSGGPVEKDKGFIIYDSQSEWESSIRITSEIKVCTSKTILQDIALGKGPQNYLIALGCAGWEAGQLEKEIKENSWLTVPAIPELIFSQDHSSKLTKAAGTLGVDIRQLPQEAGHS